MIYSVYAVWEAYNTAEGNGKPIETMY